MPVIHQSTDINQATADAVDYVTDDETLIIDPGVHVLSQAGNAVCNCDDYANATLINHGFIGTMDAFSTVNLGKSNLDIFNASGAEIFNGGNGVAIWVADIYPDTNSITNHGEIIGGDGILFWGPGIFNVNNHGYIHGLYNGVDLFSFYAGATIRNYNTVLGNTHAISVYTPGFLTVVYNAASGLLEGPDAIDVQGGMLHFRNLGTVIGSVNVQDAEDAVIINTGTILGDVYLGLGGGNDFFNGTGGTSGAIYGGGGNDRIIAGKGTVDIHVGGGNDLITGGGGSDRFIFDSPLAGQIETISNFHPLGAHPFRGEKIDKIVLSETDFAGIVPGPNGHTLSQGEFYVDIAPKNGLTKIVYDSGNGFLYFSPVNESGLPQQHIHFATINPHLALTYADFLVEA